MKIEAAPQPTSPTCGAASIFINTPHLGICATNYFDRNAALPLIELGNGLNDRILLLFSQLGEDGKRDDFSTRRFRFWKVSRCVTKIGKRRLKMQWNWI